MQQVRASPSVCAKLCKMEKVTNFTHFKQKTPISVSVKLCINAQLSQ